MNYFWNPDKDVNSSGNGNQQEVNGDNSGEDNQGKEEVDNRVPQDSVYVEADPEISHLKK